MNSKGFLSADQFLNNFRERLQPESPVIGTMVTLPGSIISELTAPSFDFLCLDLEHSALGRSDLSDVLVGASAAGKPLLVRVPSVESDLITIALDSGCAGLVFPNVENTDQIQEAISRCTYPPAGRRGYGPRRANGHGRQSQLPGPVVVAQIESVGGLKEAGEIAKVKGLDLLLVGTADLSYSLGVPGRVNSQEVNAGLSHVASVAAAAGTCAGVAGPLDHDALKIWAQLPFSMFLLSTEARIFASALDEFAFHIREAIFGREPGRDDDE